MMRCLHMYLKWMLYKLIELFIECGERLTNFKRLIKREKCYFKGKHRKFALERESFRNR